jgi:DNA-binding XRE family transcriptional regulator
VPNELGRKMSTLNTVGPTLRKAREAAGLTQTEVADALGITLWTYNRLENGKRTFESGWISHLPPSMRRPVVRLLVHRAQQNLNFLRGLDQPVPRLEIA